MAVKLVLDEHFPPTIAEQLRLLDYDVTSVALRVPADLAPLRGRKDLDLLRWACAEGRILVTENVVDFMQLHRPFLTRGEEHAGILLFSRRRFRRHRDVIGPLVRALVEFIEEHPEGLHGEIAWL